MLLTETMLSSRRDQQEATTCHAVKKFTIFPKLL
jgi:hypothetical protein